MHARQSDFDTPATQARVAYNRSKNAQRDTVTAYPGLTAIQRAIGHSLINKTRQRKPVIDQTYAEIAEENHCQPRTVERAVKRFKEIGLITVQRRRYQPSVIKLTHLTPNPAPRPGDDDFIDDAGDLFDDGSGSVLNVEDTPPTTSAPPETPVPDVVRTAPQSAFLEDREGAGDEVRNALQSAVLEGQKRTLQSGQDLRLKEEKTLKSASNAAERVIARGVAYAPKPDHEHAPVDAKRWERRNRAVDHVDLTVPGPEGVELDPDWVQQPTPTPFTGRKARRGKARRPNRSASGSRGKRP